MEIPPNLPLSGLAGTARSQAKGSEADRPAAEAGVAENRQISDTGEVHEGQRSEDRDADGRQLLDQQPSGDGSREEDTAEQGHAEAAENPHHPPSTDPHLGRRLDFDA
jgi:hypothetical protein